MTRVSADDATLDDLATAVASARVVAVRLEALERTLADGDPAAVVMWVEAVADLRRRVVRDGNALMYAHLRESGEPPPRYLSVSRPRRCRIEVMDTDRSNTPVECGQPSSWRFVAPESAVARYGCPDHEADLRAEARAVRVEVERLPA